MMRYGLIAVTLMVAVTCGQTVARLTTTERRPAASAELFAATAEVATTAEKSMIKMLKDKLHKALYGDNDGARPKTRPKHFLSSVQDALSNGLFDVVPARPDNGTQRNTGRRASTSGHRNRDLDATTTSATAAADTVYDAERECVSANDGRPCVCVMDAAVYLESVLRRLRTVGRLLDDGGSAGDVMKCRLFRVAAVGPLVVRPASAEDDGDATADRPSATTAATAVGTNVSNITTQAPSSFSDPSPVWKELNVESVLKYRLSKPDHGKSSSAAVRLGSLRLPPPPKKKCINEIKRYFRKYVPFKNYFVFNLVY